MSSLRWVVGREVEGEVREGQSKEERERYESDE